MGCAAFPTIPGRFHVYKHLPNSLTYLFAYSSASEAAPALEEMFLLAFSQPKTHVIYLLVNFLLFLKAKLDFWKAPAGIEQVYTISKRFDMKIIMSDYSVCIEKLLECIVLFSIYFQLKGVPIVSGTTSWAFSGPVSEHNVCP